METKFQNYKIRFFILILERFKKNIFNEKQMFPPQKMKFVAIYYSFICNFRIIQNGIKISMVPILLLGRLRF